MAHSLIIFISCKSLSFLLAKHEWHFVAKVEINQIDFLLVNTEDYYTSLMQNNFEKIMTLHQGPIYQCGIKLKVNFQLLKFRII